MPTSTAEQETAKERLPMTGAYKIITWGCQMNVEDSEQIGRFMGAAGFSETTDLSAADVVLLNTCSVRRKPEDKAFSMLGVLHKIKAQKPALVIGVCGCMAQLRADEIRKRAPHVDFVVGTANISSIPGLVAESRQRRRFAKRVDLPARTGAIVTDLPMRKLEAASQAPISMPKLKAFVPIQYGCDKFCTFCVVPTTRGRERSRPTDEILDEIRQLAIQGTKEVTLLGQTVNSYGKNLLEGKVPFAQLLWQIAEIPGIERIRYTSPYPRDFREDLVRAHRNCSKVVEHCHLPLQSGDDDLLKAMKRQYTAESFTQIYEMLRAIPRLAVTTDIIVGFAGETEEQFQNTLRLVERLRFDAAFTFAYSPRPGTVAADWPNQISRPVKERRLAELISLQNSITEQIHQSLVGETFEVLIEGVAAKQRGGATDDLPLLKGLSRDFKTIHFLGSRDRIGRIVNVVSTEAHHWGLYAELTA